MADTTRTQPDESPRDDANAVPEFEDTPSPPKRSHEEPIRGQGGQSGPTDPDSAESDINRDDTVTDEA